MSDLQIWTPRPFAGTDLMPMIRATNEDVVKMDLDAPIKTPQIKMLAGLSAPVQDKIEGAEAGKFWFTGTNEVIEPPFRCLLIFNHAGNALFPKGDNPDYQGLEMCLSNDGITGSVYGECAECRKCTEWRKPYPGTTKKRKPLGTKVHAMIVMTNRGPAYLRAGSTSYPAADSFLHSIKWAHENPWAHPMVVDSVQRSNQLPGGKTAFYHVLKLGWDRSETCPPDVSKVYKAMHEEFREAWEHGRLQNEDGGMED
jgi:hypothetical protein